MCFVDSLLLLRSNSQTYGLWFDFSLGAWSILTELPVAVILAKVLFGRRTLQFGDSVLLCSRNGVKARTKHVRARAELFILVFMQVKYCVFKNVFYIRGEYNI